MAGESVRAVDRAFDILDAFSTGQPELSLSEISSKVGLPTTTVFRMLQTLETRGILQKNERGNYVLGLELLKYHKIVVGTLDVRSQAYRAMESLRDATQETVNLYTLRGDKRVCIESLEGYGNLKFHAYVGDSFPLHLGASGKVLLAYQPSAYLETYWVRYSSEIKMRTGLNEKAFLKMLAGITEQGYAESLGEREYGLRSISAPIFGHTGRVTDALTVTGPEARLTDERVAGFIKLLIPAARSVSRSMGYM